MTVSSTCRFVGRERAKDRRCGPISPGSSPGGPKPPRAGGCPAPNVSSPGGPPMLPPHPEPELMGGAASVRPFVCCCCCGASLCLVSSTTLPPDPPDHAFVVERILPKPFTTRSKPSLTRSSVVMASWLWLRCISGLPHGSDSKPPPRPKDPRRERRDRAEFGSCNGVTWGGGVAGRPSAGSEGPLFEVRSRLRKPLLGWGSSACKLC